MGDFAARIKARLWRRNSASPSLVSSTTSVKSGRPRSQSTKYAASSIKAPSVGESRNGEKENVDPHDEEAKLSHNSHSRHNGFIGGLHLRGLLNHATSKGRPSTRASTAASISTAPSEDVREPSAITAADGQLGEAQARRSDEVHRHGESDSKTDDSPDVIISEMAASHASREVLLHGAADAELVRGSGGGETLRLASSKVRMANEPSSGQSSDHLPLNTSYANSNTNTTTVSSLGSTADATTLGNDLHSPNPANTSQSANPAISTPLPSINEIPSNVAVDIDKNHSNPVAAIASQTSLPQSAADTASPSFATTASHAVPIPTSTTHTSSPDLPRPSSATPSATVAVGPATASPIDVPTRDGLLDLRSPGIDTTAAPIPTNGIVTHQPSSPTADRPGVPRRQSILPTGQTSLTRTLLDTGRAQELGQTAPEQFVPISGNMVTRKLWVKRPGASATQITVNEDELVDDVRDMILRKYANSLGRTFDSPDLTLRIVPRGENSRQLQPDEPMGRTLDAYYPGGQTVEDALLIDVPTRRTPKASPNPRFHGEDRPHESGSDYFPPYPPAAHSHHPNIAAPATTIIGGGHTLHFPPSMAILGNGQLPPLPSPGGSRRLGPSRPKIQRLHTASPVSTVGNGTHTAHVQSQQQHVQHAPVPVAASIGTHTYTRPTRSRTHSGASSDQSNHPPHTHQPPAAPPMPTPPAPERVATPPPRIASPRPSTRPKKKKTIDAPSLPPGMLNGNVPPINVLIVEDNIINLRLLEAFVKRLKVRWQTAMNGRDAVTKWRSGGFHLVLMDIQLPVMNGLDATREIRRLEKVNSIGVFSSSASKAPSEVSAELDEADRLSNLDMFKSPVIIVALTASSLQSDRHEALAAGCNDFLTKPVNFVWLERKVMEWGCMQALIDFDGWRKWKDFSQQKAEEEKAAAKAKANKKNRVPLPAATAAA